MSSRSLEQLLLPACYDQPIDQIGQEVRWRIKQKKISTVYSTVIVKDYIIRTACYITPSPPWSSPPNSIPHPQPTPSSSLHKSGSVSTLAHLLFFKVDFFFARLSQNRFEPTGQPVLRRGLLDRSWRRRRRRRHRNLARSSNKQ